MTPREKIREQARKLYPNTATHPMESANFCGFTAGGAYGYNLAIENVVNWLKVNVSSFTLKREEIDGLPKRNRVELHELIKQAMKL